jgi:hypothetical protein
MGGLRLTIDSTNQVGAEHKKCSKPKAQKARIWSKIKAKTCVSKQTCPRMCTRTGSTYPCVSIFSVNHVQHGSQVGVSDTKFQIQKTSRCQFPTEFPATLQASKHGTATLFYLGLGNLID